MNSVSQSIKAFSLIIAVTTTMMGCSGSSSDSTGTEGADNGNQTPSNPIPPLTPEQVLNNLSFTVKRQADSPITQENAEAVILDAIKVLDYLVDEHSSYVNNEGGVISVDESLPTVIENQLDCNIDGVQTSTMNAPSQLIQDGYRVYGDGDSLSVKYTGCDFIGSPIWGSVVFEVDQGVWNLTHAVSSGTVLSHTFDQFFYTSNDGSALLRYHDGILTRTINDLSHIVKSEEFAIFDYEPTYDIEIVLSNVDFTVSQYEVNEFWVGDQILTNDLLTVESNQVGIKYHIAVTEFMKRPEVTADAFTDGAMLLAGQIGTLYVQFRDGYLDYELDADSDGTFETSGVIDASQY